MRWLLYSTAVAVLLSGCASVRSTSEFYLPGTERVFAPKPKDFQAPILNTPPARRHEVIGQLAFSTSRGWRFVRESIEWNARANGADAAILREATTSVETGLARTPPTTEWVPVPGLVVCDEHGYAYYRTEWVPVMRPGFVYPTTWQVISFVADMIVYKL